MKTFINKNSKSAFIIFFAVVLLLISSCSNSSNPSTKPSTKPSSGGSSSGSGSSSSSGSQGAITGDLFTGPSIAYLPNGIPVVEIPASSLVTTINSFSGGSNIIYKVTGQMSKNEYASIHDLLGNKHNSWGWNNYVGLDLSEVTGLTKIDDTYNLISLRVPATLSSFGDEADLDNIIIPATNQNFKNTNDVLYSTDGKILYHYSKTKNENSFTIPTSVKKIWKNAFRYNDSIQNITIPSGAVFIGRGAFDCSNITNLTFGDKNGWLVMQDCDYIPAVNPDEIENPDKYSWSNNAGKFARGIFKPARKTVTASQLETEVANYEAGYYTIYSVIGSMTLNQYDNIRNNINNKKQAEWYYNINYIGLDLSQVTDLTKISSTGSLLCLTIPDTVSEFTGWIEFVKITITDNNPYFINSSGVIYSTDLKILYYYSFLNEETSFEIPNGVATIEGSAFASNHNIRSITIPSSVTKIDSNVFDSQEITTLTFESTTGWKRWSNGNKVDVSATELSNPANFRWNNDTGSSGICRDGIFKE